MNLEPTQYAYGSDHYWLAIELRRNVLRLPLGLDFSEEDLAAEAEETFFGIFKTDGAIATLSLQLHPHYAKMRQVAVHSNFQGKGLGSKIVLAAEEFAIHHRLPLMTLHARETAVAFYTHLGYQVEGDPFTEVTIPHFKMKKSLTKRILSA